MYKKMLSILLRVFVTPRKGWEKEDSELSKKDREELEVLPRYTPAKIRFMGNKFEVVDAPTFLSSYDEIFKREIYKFETEHSIPVIIDCGANIGLSTIYFKRLYSNAIVYAYEPDIQLFNAMRLNVVSMGFSDIRCFNNAVSDKNAQLLFHREGGHSGMLVDEHGEDVIMVDAVRLKEIIEEQEYISFLKIDIEGHEDKVLRDIKDQLFKVEYLFLEYHSFIDHQQTLAELLEILTANGFRYYIKEAYNKTLPFVQKEIFLGMDLLLNIFCYRT
jgi:FkbM family methyltransferase